MLSDEVIVKTKAYNDIYQYELQLAKGSEYICLSEIRNPEFLGTEIILKYDQFILNFEDNIDKLREFINENFLTESVNIKVIVLHDMEKSYELDHPLNLDAQQNNNTHIIDVSKYLNDIYGYIFVNLKKNIFGYKCSDIASGEISYFDCHEVIDNTEEIDLDLLYNNYSVTYLEIPIVTSEYKDEYEKCYDVLNDEEEAIQKIEGSLGWITIFLNKECSGYLPYSDSYIVKYNDEIIHGLPFEKLFDYSQDEECPAIVYKNIDKLLYDSSNKVFLPFTDPGGRKGYWNKNNFETKLFLRDVYVNLANIKKLNVIPAMNVNGIRINIINKNIFTDISRKNLTEESSNMLSYAINKILFVWLLDNISLSLIEQKLLRNFIDTFYADDNMLIK